MALVRWEPVRELNSLQSEMNRLFNTFFDTPTTGNGSAARRWLPAMDLVETDDHFVLTADLPGLGEEDVTIEVEDNVLTVSGERKAEHEDKREGFVRVERVVRRLPPLADAARGRRRRRRQRQLRQGRPRDPHPQARGAQAAPGRDPGRRRPAAIEGTGQPSPTHSPAGPRTARARAERPPYGGPRWRSPRLSGRPLRARAPRPRLLDLRLDQLLRPPAPQRSTHHSTSPPTTITTAPPTPAMLMKRSALWPDEVRDQGDRRRPRDTAQRVPEQERRPRHPRHPGHPRRRDAQAGHPAPEEDCLRPMAIEERLADGDDPPAVMQQRPRRGQQPAARACARSRTRRCRRGSRPRRRPRSRPRSPGARATPRSPA